MGTADRIERERLEKRARILDAARELFVERGVAAVTLREVAQRIEYSTTAIYVQFKDQAALVQRFSSLRATRAGQLPSKLRNMSRTVIIATLVALAPPAAAGELVAVIVPATGYDLFLPDAAAGKAAKPVTAHVELRDAVTHANVRKHFRATLTLESSHLPGACVNCPTAKSLAAEPADFYFDAAKNARGRISGSGTVLTLADGETPATIASRDWGGFATLRARVILDGGVALDAVTASGDAGLAIPKDDNGNHIADYWEVLGNVRRADAPDADDERAPPLAIPGDGIALIDEYRGFLEDDARGKPIHTRLNPNQRDVFVSLALIPPHDRASALAGVALWAAMTNVAVHVGHATRELVVTIDRAAARAAIEQMICLVDPACTTGDAARRTAFVARLGAAITPAQRALRAGWGKQHTDALLDRYVAFVVVRDLGRALHAREPTPEPTCPMHAWETDDPAIADFVGGVWDLAAAPGDKPWRWCDEPDPQMRLRDLP